ncbi:MAG: hypothetical protein NVSMB31_00200 [Vulcanimicrobiaceae bacterium]
MRVLVLFALLFTLCAPAFGAGPSAGQSAVLVVGEFQGHRAFGSGVIIGVRGGLRIATAGHVGALGNARVVTQAGEELAVTSVHFVSGYDLALLQTAPASMSYVPARRGQTVTRNQAVEIWGYGDSSSPRMLAATVVSPRIIFPATPETAKLALTCELCAHGDSGAGAFTQDGSLIGLVVARWSDRAHTISVMETEPIDALDEVMAKE